MADVPLVNNPMTAVADMIVGGTVTGGVAAPTRLKNNWSAAVAPAVTDDSGDGYAIGSRWIDTTADKEYVALDVTVGAAVWTETTGGGGGSGSITASGYTQATARLLGRTTAAAGAIEEITVGSGLSLAAGSLTATGTATFSGCRAYHNTTQAPGGAPAALALNSEDFDTNTYHDNATANSRMTAPFTGYYLVVAKSGVISATNSYIYLYKNGAAIRGCQGGNSNTGYFAEISATVQLNATEYVEMYGYANTWGHASTAEQQTTLEITYLGA
jgi:hypothetical protein